MSKIILFYIAIFEQTKSNRKKIDINLPTCLVLLYDLNGRMFEVKGREGGSFLDLRLPELSYVSSVCILASVKQFSWNWLISFSDILHEVRSPR